MDSGGRSVGVGNRTSFQRPQTPASRCASIERESRAKLHSSYPGSPRSRRTFARGVGRAGNLHESKPGLTAKRRPC
jgi:hypothetical protein